MRRILSMSTGLCLLSGCWAFGSDGSRLEGRYRLAQLERPWTTVDAGGADYAWWHRESGATIYSDSNCEKGYSDSSLERLANAQSAAIDDAEQVSLREHRLAERDALTAVYSGQVDGVPVVVTTTILKKDRCIYDFVMVAPVGSEDVLTADYDSLVASFREK